MNFASEQPLGSVTGLVFFGPTRRLAYAANLTATCPKMAPAGWNLYAAASTPHPATGDFDADHEVALLKADLHEHFPGFDSARILSVEICAGEDCPHSEPSPAAICRKPPRSQTFSMSETACVSGPRQARAAACNPRAW